MEVDRYMGFWHHGGPGLAFGLHMGGRKRGRRFRRGILKFVILKLLAESARHGYDLMRVFAEKGWGSRPGSIYPILNALEPSRTAVTPHCTRAKALGQDHPTGRLAITYPGLGTSFPGLERLLPC